LSHHQQSLIRGAGHFLAMQNMMRSEHIALEVT
jgi:hypothetical protein